MNACNDVVNCGSLDVKCCDFSIEVVGTSMSRSWNSELQRVGWLYSVCAHKTMTVSDL